MAFNFSSFMGILQLAPYVVEGVFQLHQGASTETKTQIATDALQLAAGVAGAVIPGETALITAASAGIQGVIAVLSQAKAGGATLVPSTSVSAGVTK